MGLDAGERRLTPAEQMLVHLRRMRKNGWEFEKAWDRAFSLVKWPHATDQRRDWKEVLVVTKADWRSAYEGLDAANSVRVLTIFEGR